jgi:hypothetical protein
MTRTPAGPVPRAPRPVLLLVPLADLFMIAMVSRPATGSLRTTWVTPATRWLCVAAALIALLAVITLRPAQQWLAILEMVVLASFVAGSTAVALIAFWQTARLRAPQSDERG